MAAVDCSKTPRSKSTKARALTLRPHEARKLAEDGRVLVVREVKLVQFGPSDTPGYDWTFRRGPGGVWEDYRTAGLLASKYCPLGPVGSPLWGRETYMLAARDPDERDWQGDGKLPGVAGRPHIDWYGNPALAVIFRTDGEHVSDTGVRMAWYSPVGMPALASRFPRLRHESCEVKRADGLTWDDLASMGLPDGPDRIVKPGSSPIEYIEIKPDDMVAQLHGTPAGRWAWCSLVVDLDRLEVADA